MKIILFAISLVFALSACSKNADEIGNEERKAAGLKRLIGPAAEPGKK